MIIYEETIHTRAGTINRLINFFTDNQVTLYNINLSNEYINELIFILCTSNTLAK